LALCHTHLWSLLLNILAWRWLVEASKPILLWWRPLAILLLLRIHGDGISRLLLIRLGLVSLGETRKCVLRLLSLVGRRRKLLLLLLWLLTKVSELLLRLSRWLAQTTLLWWISLGSLLLRWLLVKLSELLVMLLRWRLLTQVTKLLLWLLRLTDTSLLLRRLLTKITKRLLLLRWLRLHSTSLLWWLLRRLLTKRCKGLLLLLWWWLALLLTEICKTWLRLRSLLRLRLLWRLSKRILFRLCRLLVKVSKSLRLWLLRRFLSEWILLLRLTRPKAGKVLLLLLRRWTLVVGTGNVLLFLLMLLRWWVLSKWIWLLLRLLRLTLTEVVKGLLLLLRLSEWVLLSRLTLATKVGESLLRLWLLLLLLRRLLRWLLSKRILLLLLRRLLSEWILWLLIGSTKGIPTSTTLLWRRGWSLKSSPQKIHIRRRWLLILVRNLHHCRLRLTRPLWWASLLLLLWRWSPLLLSGSSSTLLSTIAAIPGLILVLATNPGTKLLLVLVSLGWFHPISRRVVSGQPERVDFIIVRLLHRVDFLLREGRMTHSLDAIVDFTMNTSTCHTDKTTKGQVDT
jgi:hypothetical protein